MGGSMGGLLGRRAGSEGFRIFLVLGRLWLEWGVVYFWGLGGFGIWPLDGLGCCGIMVCRLGRDDNFMLGVLVMIYTSAHISLLREALSLGLLSACYGIASDPPFDSFR